MKQAYYGTLRLTCYLIAALLLAPASVWAQDGTLNPKQRKLLDPSVVQRFEGLDISPQARERIRETILARRQAKQNLTPAQRKMSSLLLDALPSDSAQQQNQRFSLRSAPPTPILNVNGQGVQVSIELERASAATLAELEAAGASVSAVHREEGRVVARVPFERLEAVAGLEAVKSIMPVVGEITRVGSVTSGGVEALNVDAARSQFGLTGSGVKIAVISNGTGGLADAQASGDLPADVELCPINDNVGAEGTAMLEIVYDMAPGAELAFCPGFGNGQVGLANAVTYLANNAFGGTGADVIVDDLAFLTEPYFEDGIIAQAVDAAAAGGATYFSSAGNSALSHYENEYVDSAPEQSGFFVNLHDFGQAAGLASDVDWLGVVGSTAFAPSNFFAAFLQWTEPFGEAATDYDLYIFDQNGFPAGNPNGDFPIGVNGTAVQDGSGTPLEIAVIINENEQNLPFFMIIDRFSGDPDKLMEMNFNGAFGLDQTYVVPEGSVWGHAAAEGAIAVAAINVSDEGLDDIEPFSSRGPSRIFFPSFEARAKPDLTAVDGVMVTGAGGFPTTFFGTSAAAPHAAGVAGLLKEAQPALSPEEAAGVLMSTALDRGAPGFDFVFGAGLIDAFAAAAALIEEDDTPPVCGPVTPLLSADGQLEAVETFATDTESGIASVRFTTLRNLQGFLDDGSGQTGPYAEDDEASFDPAQTERIDIRGERIDFQQGGVILTEVTNGAGLSSTCDPVIETLAAQVPRQFSLEASYPNPSAGAVTIAFNVAEQSHVVLEVYDVLGRRVATLVDEELAPRGYSVRWDARSDAAMPLPSGVYLYRMQAGSFAATGRMTLVR